MRLKPGDRVKTMDDTANYTVVRLLSGNFALVKTDDGLEMPLSVEKLIITVMKPENLSFPDNCKQSDVKAVSKRKKRYSSGGKVRSKVVDLHMKGSYSGAKDLTTIDVQLIRFRDQLDSAIRDGYKEITFIHGVGSGRLKTELRRVISENYPSCTFQDASFIEYGVGGATLIVISKKG